MDNEEGISMPSVPKPIPRPMPNSSSEGNLPEAPSPGGSVPGHIPVPAPRAEHHMPRAEHHHPKSPPPLFIKIDKYQDVVQNLQKLKSLALSLRDALDALADIEKELTTGINISHKALDDFNTIISMLDSKLTRIGDVRDAEKSVGTSGEVNTYVRDIYSQMDRIKQELKNVSEEV